MLKLKNCLVLIEILGKDLRVNYEGKEVILQMKMSSNIIVEAIPHQLSIPLCCWSDSNVVSLLEEISMGLQTARREKYKHNFFV